MTEPSSLPPLRVAIIGGGLSGALVAWHLARATTADQAAITVIEPRADLGRGLAYATPDPDHRLNVPATKMTIDTSDPDHYRRWLAAPGAPALDSDATTPAGDVFTPRHVFGHYVAQHLAPLVASGRITHRRARATAALRHGQGYQLTLDDGTEVAADLLVLAVSHPAPALPKELSRLAGHPALIPDAYADRALDAIAAEDAVLIVGSGLTGGDVVATLHARAHRGRIVLLSRHGRRPQTHGPRQAETTADFTRHPETRASALLQRIRAALRADHALGLTWHAVLDRVRAQGPAIWAALPQAERQRVLRHLRGLWDVHRFRIAPQTQAAVEAEIHAGRLTPLTGRIRAVTPEGSRIALDIAVQGDGVTRLVVDRVVLATGPAHGTAITTTPVLADLARQGLIAADPLGLGISVTAEGIVPGSQDTILVAGPLGRGAVGELMGVPEITACAERIAKQIACRVATAAPAVPLAIDPA